MEHKKCHKILIASEYDWGNKSQIREILHHIFHDVLGFSDTLKKLIEKSNEMKQKRKKVYIGNKQKFSIERKIRKQKKKDGEKLEPYKFEKIKLEDDEKIDKDNCIKIKVDGKEELFNKSKNDVRVYIRDRKVDNRLRHCFTDLGFRVVQSTGDWENSENAGIQRNEKIFNLELDYVIVFTKWKEENNGIDHIFHLCEVKKTPLIIIDNYELKFKSFNVIDNIETEIIENKFKKEKYTEKREKIISIPKKGSKEHEESLAKSLNIRRMYYKGLKDCKIKFTTEEEILFLQNKNKQQLKIKRKKKKKQIKEMKEKISYKNELNSESDFSD